MALYDTPIKTDSAGLPRILDAGLPILLYLYKTQNDALDTVLEEAAEDFAGDVLIVKVNADENPDVHTQYDSPALPAVVTLDEGIIESRASGVLPQDIDDHVMFLMGQGPYPDETAAERAAAAAEGDAPFHTSDATFEEDVLGADVPILVDFWAPWCGPCHMIAPVLERLSGKYAGQMRVAKLNVDENQQTSMTYGVQGIPMLMMFKDGEPLAKLVGAHPEPSIEQLIQQAL